MRWRILTLDGNNWFAEGMEKIGGEWKVYNATNIPNSLENRINAILSAMLAKAGYHPQDTFIECRVRPKGIPENAGQKHSKATVMLNFRDKFNQHQQLQEPMLDLIVTNTEYNSLTWNEVPQ